MASSRKPPTSRAKELKIRWESGARTVVPTDPMKRTEPRVFRCLSRAVRIAGKPVFRLLIGALLGWSLSRIGHAEAGGGDPAASARSIAAEPYLNAHWSERDGIPGGAILDLLESDDGYLWVCTKYGLRVFDGFRFFLPEGLEHLRDEPVQRVVASGEGQLLLRGRGVVFSIARRANGLYEEHRNPGTDLVRDGDGWVWLETGDVIRGRRGNLEAVLPPGPDPGAGSATFMPALWGARRGGVYRADDRGTLWLGTPQGWSRIPSPLPPDQRVRWCEVFEDRQQRIWMSLLTPSDEAILFWWQHGQWHRLPRPHDSQLRLGRCISQTSTGEILIGASRGLIYRFTDPESAPRLYRIPFHPEAIQAIHEDSMGNWWVGSEESGLRLIGRESHALLTGPEPSSSEPVLGEDSLPVRGLAERPPFPVSSIALDARGQLWAAVGSHGLWVRRGDRLELATNVPAVMRDRSYVTVVAQSPRGLAVGGSGFLMELDADGRLIPGRDHSASVAGGSVVSLAVDTAGTLWAGTDSGRLIRCPEDGSPTRYPVGHPVFDLAIQKDRVWVLAGDQLRCWTGRDWETPPEALARVHHPQSLFVDQQDRLMVVGASELVLWDGIQAARLGADQGFVPRMSSKGFQDSKSGLWLASDVGILELNSAWIERALTANPRGSGTVESTEAIGRVIPWATLSEIGLTAKRAGAPWTLPSGEVALPSNKGVLLVSLASDRPRRPGPQVRIASLRTGSRGLFEGAVSLTNVCIPDGVDLLVGLQRNLQANLHPPLLRYSSSQDVPVWSHLGDATAIRIDRPVGGRFPLRIQSKRFDGSWNEVGVTWVEVDQPHTLSGAWRAVIIGSILMLGALVVWQFYRSAFHQRSVRIRTLEGVQSDRLRIGRSLHDDLGNRLSEIQLLAEQVALFFTPGEPTSPMVERIRRRSVEATEALDNMVWLLRDVSEPAVDLGRHMELLARNYLDTCSVDLDYQVLAGQQFEIGGWVRQLLIAATQELTRNAVRHGRATRIEIRMRVSEDAVSYRVEDNGTGFDHRRAVTLGRGLSNLLGRVEDMGGTASVVSKFGASVILIQVPRVVR